MNRFRNVGGESEKSNVGLLPRVTLNSRQLAACMTHLQVRKPQITRGVGTYLFLLIVIYVEGNQEPENVFILF